MGVKFGESRGIHIIIMFVWILLGMSSMALSAPVAQQDDQETQTSSSSSSETSSQSSGGFDTAAILALAGATGTPVQSGTSYGRRRRSAIESGVDELRRSKSHTPNQSGLVSEHTEKSSEEQTEPSVASTTSKCGYICRVLAIAGAKPSKVSISSGYGRRRKRRTAIDWEKENVIPVDEVLVKKVIAEDVNKGTDPEGSVKVKTLSNVGDQIQPGNSSEMPQKVFRRKFLGYGRKKRDATKPVSSRTVAQNKKAWLPRKGKFLQIEQTDALATPRNTKKDKATKAGEQ